MSNGAALHSAAAWKQRVSAWWPVQLGLLIMYLPTLYDLLTGIWTNENYAHGPIILVLSIWLLQRQWGDMQQQAAGKAPATRGGWALVGFALLLYIIGRSQDILMFEMGSFIVMLAGLMLMVYGGAALKRQWFPFFFMLFMIPLPSVIVDSVTMPMKMAVSYATEHLLFWLGYPIARTGVVLQIGQYQLMVADACAGLQTLLTLESLGLFYLNVVRHTSAFRNIALAILIIPISFTANVIRVITLTLITYYFGDAAGQGFLHGFAGMVLFISALLLILGLDTFLQYIVRRRQPAAREAAL
ncbi:exosortase B [Duganella sp. SG902]|uniref:exosortase B n=1 Tax=Duganella sp. SG902 TaxID=2587016 RepID=UPI00159E411C|nr:exosortase B [Duganella sp. SG902]NVM78717.1 exosortase B [Duganella sp. SG902]